MPMQFIDILQHNIRWWMYDKNVPEFELPDEHIEQIEEAITAGFNCGPIIVSGSFINNKTKQLSFEQDYTGYWEIIDWKNIAGNMYLAIVAKDIREARKALEENWNEDA